MSELKIIIVDDNETFRKGLGFYIENILSYSVIGEASNGEEFLNIPNTAEADIVLMDIEMPQMNGIETLKTYIWYNRDLNTIAITNYEDEVYLSELIGAGFKGFVSKKNIYKELRAAIDTVIDGKIYFPETLKL